MASSSSNVLDEDLAPTSTAGYKVGAKKTAEELANMDAGDESLRKWKESLGLKAGGPTGCVGLNANYIAADPRNVVVESLALEVNGRSDVVINLGTPADIEKLKDQQLTIKEGVEYRLKVRFRVNHDVVSGLKYLHVVKRGGIKSKPFLFDFHRHGFNICEVDKMEEMLGSYGPSADSYEKKFALEEAPSGMIARGHYSVKSRFVDDDAHCHLEWSWSFDIKKDWD
ncbi:hypothetical protein HK101_005044 [Irineochytrium annulatum]|nr:hypothetical protein HK101_005044 [Irineochytrium annulatum]